jgi:hypothetical protein
VNKKEFIKINNSNQFEIRVGYLADKIQKKIDFGLNIYVFIPKNLGINPSTYSNDDFYSDTTSYIRLITPKYELGILKKKFKGLVESLKKNIEDKSIIKHEIKLVICSYSSYLKIFTKDIKYKGIKPKRIRVLLKRIKEIDEIKKELLSLKENQNDSKLTYFLESAAEYLSLTTQHFLFKINIHIKNSGEGHYEIINSIINQINEEIKFCKKNDFPIISSDEYENERVIFRYSVFKKYFYSVLYLYQNKKEDGVGIKEFYYAIAAGISMIFATIVVFATRHKYGNFTTSFFVALVISYMFKDRIKEAYRHYFDKKMELKIFDFKRKIYDTKKQSLFACIKERMRFTNKRDLDKEIKNTRLKGVHNRLSTWYIGEDILKYEKKISLYNKNIQHYYNNTINGIHTIIRFDITKFLKKMDTPKVPLYRVNQNSIYGSKVYHVNIVIEYISKEETSYHKARLILDKNGIKRVELPEFDIKMFAGYVSKRDKNWFSLKKSGLLKNYKAIESKSKNLI